MSSICPDCRHYSFSGGHCYCNVNPNEPPTEILPVEHCQYFEDKSKLNNLTYLDCDACQHCVFRDGVCWCDCDEISCFEIDKDRRGCSNFKERKPEEVKKEGEKIVEREENDDTSFFEALSSVKTVIGAEAFKHFLYGNIVKHAICVQHSTVDKIKELQKVKKYAQYLSLELAAHNTDAL